MDNPSSACPWVGVGGPHGVTEGCQMGAPLGCERGASGVRAGCERGASGVPRWGVEVPRWGVEVLVGGVDGTNQLGETVRSGRTEGALPSPAHGNAVGITPPKESAL